MKIHSFRKEKLENPTTKYTDSETTFSETFTFLPDVNGRKFVERKKISFLF